MMPPSFNAAHRASRRGFVAGLAACAAAGTLGTRAEADPSPDPKLKQKVSANEANSSKPTTVARGHVDIGTRFVDGTFTVMGRDDTVSPPVWRSVDSLVLRVVDAGQLRIPEDPAYAFLGLPQGKKVHVIPQTQLPDVLWLGWNTQDPEVVSALGRGADLIYHRHQGPGELHVFIANGFDAPLPLWDSRKPAGQKIWMDTNSHVHANWIFTEPGVHLVEVEVKGTDARTQQPLSARGTLRFGVGGRVTDAEVRAARWEGENTPSQTPTSSARATSAAPASSATPSGPASSTSTPAPIPSATAPTASTVTPTDGGSSMPWVVGASSAGALVAAVSGGLLWRQRRLRAEAWAADDDTREVEGD